jgi:hypothetical protein
MTLASRSKFIPRFVCDVRFCVPERGCVQRTRAGSDFWDKMVEGVSLAEYAEFPWVRARDWKKLRRRNSHEIAGFAGTGKVGAPGNIRSVLLMRVTV